MEVFTDHVSVNDAGVICLLAWHLPLRGQTCDSFLQIQENRNRNRYVDDPANCDADLYVAG